MIKTLCYPFSVPEKHFDQSRLPASLREVDFYLIGNSQDEVHRCEIKLMGKGNPESADAVIARDSRVFVADKLSDLNKTQLTSLGVEWVELRDINGFKKFEEVLGKLEIPHKFIDGDLDETLENIFKEIF